MKLVLDSGNKVLMYGDDPEAPAGCRSVALSAENEAEFLSLPADRAGVIFDDAALAFTLIPRPPFVPPSASEIIDRAFPQTGTARVVFEAFFEIANRLRALEGKLAIDRPQLKSWLESKLP